MNLIMKNNQLLIEKVDAQKNRDGIVYTQEQGCQSWEGKVVATYDTNEYPVGAVVIFYEKAGELVWLDGKKFLMLDSDNIWGIRCQ